MTGAEKVLYTIGHSAHEFPTFLQLLRGHGITQVADVRSQPTSRLPHFGREVLSTALRSAGIEYLFLGRELGARREERECYVNSQASYEKIAELPAFQSGLGRVLRGLERDRIALMCAEKEPLDCHRTILVCRQFRDLDISIRHILADGDIEDHLMTERRLLRLTGENRTLFEPNLTDDELMSRAYETRGRQIAYRVTAEGVTS